MVSCNPNLTIKFIEAHPCYDWDWWKVSQHPNITLEFIEEHPEYISWDDISSNPGIFEYDYEGMKQKMINSDFFQELMENRFHPSNYNKWRGWGFEDMVLEENDSDEKQIKKQKI